MAAASFEDLYAQTCILLGTGQVPMTPDETGARAFTITYRDADISFIERSAPQREHVSIVVRFGSYPTEQAAAILANLMHANHALMSGGAPAFVQEPGTGEILLHRLVALADIHVPGLQAVLDALAEQVARWGADYFLGEESPTPRPGPGAGHFA